MIDNPTAAHDRIRWNERYRIGYGRPEPNPRVRRHLKELRKGRVLDLAGGIGPNASLFSSSNYVVADISEEALARGAGMRVQADAAHLPFALAYFDTIICTLFFDPTLDFASLLAPGGTLFFETLTPADQKYRPDFNPTYRFDLARMSGMFRGLTIDLLDETDDGTRVYATLIAHKPAAVTCD